MPRLLNAICACALLPLAVFAWGAHAQQHGPIQMEQSNTTASLRGIHAAGPGVAWASGTNGTVLRTEDAGFVWQGCAIPPGAEKLDFRGVWAWDAMTAIVMSSGPGDQSRLYKTTDGCESWKLLLTNKWIDVFWDSMTFIDRDHGYVLGDPRYWMFWLMTTNNGGNDWDVRSQFGLNTLGVKVAAFAASNSALITVPSKEQDKMLPFFVTSSAAKILPKPGEKWACEMCEPKDHGPFVFSCDSPATLAPNRSGSINTDTVCTFKHSRLPLATNSDTAGAFSVSVRPTDRGQFTAVVVGGDFQKPSETSGTAAWSSDSGESWMAATKPPHGYRSAVAWDPANKVWITAGPNGTDVSRDDGRTWQSLESGSWNAISLPWLVGPDGRIGKLVSLQQAAQPPAVPATGQNAHTTKPGAKTR